MRGLELSVRDLAQKCNLPLSMVQLILQDATTLPAGIPSREVQSIAKALELAPLALTQLSDYTPHTSPPPELIQFTTPFGHAGVNAFLLTLGRSTILFDTGTDSSPVKDYLKRHSLALDVVYITHGHHDHISGLRDFPDAQQITAENLAHGTSKLLAPGVQLTALDTSGHFNPSRAYYITGLSSPLCICGDIIFAGSMGKTASLKLYQQSLQHARKHLMTLPPATILCPGHGPLTTVGQEALHNPFLARS